MEEGPRSPGSVGQEGQAGLHVSGPHVADFRGRVGRGCWARGCREGTAGLGQLPDIQRMMDRICP